MANIQLIEIGLSPNDRSGDSLRTAFDKTNNNFARINNELGNLSVSIQGATNIGAGGVDILAETQDNTLRFKRVVAGSGITITDLGDEISIVNNQSILLDGSAGSIVVLDGAGKLAVSGSLLLDNQDGTIALSRSINMQQNRIKSLANPSNNQDAATKAYVDNLITNTGSGVRVLENNSTIASATRLNFVGDVEIVESSSGKVDISISGGVDSSAVQSIVGSMFTNNSDRGILTEFSQGKINVDVKDFDITLTGAVSGSVNVADFNKSIVIETTSNFIDGIRLQRDGSRVGGRDNLVDTFNFVGDNFVVSRDGNVADITVSSTVSGDEIASVLNPRLLGQQEGLTISYDNLNKNYKYSVNPITLKLAGAVNGSGTVTFDGSAVDGEVTINTTGVSSAVIVADEGTVSGQASVINFVGGGITTAVSLDGTTATVFVPNSPAAEPFITASAGSENVPNARRLVAGTGVVINDSGAGGNITISANNDSIVAKNVYALDGALVAEQFGININTTQYIIPFLENDTANSQVTLNMYLLKDAWFRGDKYDAGTVENNQGPIVDFGTINGGILEATPDLGQI